MDSSYCPLKVDFTIKYNSDGTQQVIDQDNIVYTSSDSKKWLVYFTVIEIQDWRTILFCFIY